MIFKVTDKKAQIFFLQFVCYIFDYTYVWYLRQEKKDRKRGNSLKPARVLGPYFFPSLSLTHTC